jgi:hypothetical protein
MKISSYRAYLIRNYFTTINVKKKIEMPNMERPYLMTKPLSHNASFFTSFFSSSSLSFP